MKSTSSQVSLLNLVEIQNTNNEVRKQAATRYSDI